MTMTANDNRRANVLLIWTVCANPSDFPGKFTAKPTPVHAGMPFDDVLYVADSLDALRAKLESMGLARLARNPQDHPVIVEVWL